MFYKIDRYLNNLSTKDIILLFFTIIIVIFYISFLLEKQYSSYLKIATTYNDNLKKTIYELGLKQKEQNMTIIKLENIISKISRQTQIDAIDKFLIGIKDSNFIFTKTINKNYMILNINGVYYKILRLIQFIQDNKIEIVFFNIKKSNYLISAQIKIKLLLD